MQVEELTVFGAENGVVGSTLGLRGGGFRLVRGRQVGHDLVKHLSPPAGIDTFGSAAAGNSAFHGLDDSFQRHILESVLGSVRPVIFDARREDHP